MPVVAKASTCSTCGAILMGYRYDERLAFPVYFCPQCELEKPSARRTEVIPEAAYAEEGVPVWKIERLKAA
jgi:hypothetical protein